MPLSWSEIRQRAISFSKEWENTSSEKAESKSFLENFFLVFGISRRRVAVFEDSVKIRPDKSGYIDLFWKGQLIVEMKSAGKSLDKAYEQALEYTSGLKEVDLPKYILVCDFKKFRIHNLEEKDVTEFRLEELHKNINLFGFIAGYEKKTYKDEDPVNIKAAELMGVIHDKLLASGYKGHNLEVFLVRMLFCLFADDTGIFDKNIFREYVEQSGEDGSNIGPLLSQLFQILNTETSKRFSNTPDELMQFPYVNGKLFEENLLIPSFDSSMREDLIECCALDWSKISPAIFGSMFQSVMDAKARRNLGAHYTSEKNILKLIRSLFLDELWDEFEKVKDQPRRLDQFHEKIAGLRFLDPACGCGNFLVVAYRELRLLEMDIIRQKQKGQQVVHIDALVRVDVDHFYGIECEEFPAQIAQVALWLADHQMNTRIGVEFGHYFVRLPLKKSAFIYHGNALQMDWQNLIKQEHVLPFEAASNLFLLNEPDRYYRTKASERPKHIIFNYILGNPPFVGKHLQNNLQKADMLKVCADINGAGVLDYVTAWYIKAARYLRHVSFTEQAPETNGYVKCAFVSTNSITQGEQVAVLWHELFTRYHIKIHFAHRTFSWSNEARGNAAVHVVIIGFSNYDTTGKYIYEYDDIKGEPHKNNVTNINPYLVEGKDEYVTRRKTPVCPVPELIKGNQPTDNGLYLFTPEEKKTFLQQEPKAKKWFRRFIGSQELINGIERWCLWLKDIAPDELRAMPMVSERVQQVKAYRLKSPKAATRKKADTAALFDEIRQPASDYLAIPEVSSERRKYLPVAYVGAQVISSNKNYMLPNATLFQFGVLCSVMHNCWTKQVSGRLESRIQYSNGIVYNNFPWPETPTGKQKKAVELAAQKVLDVRLLFPNSCLADLYDPVSMPPALVKAHNELDKAVDLCYRPQPFVSESKRIEFLFELYNKYTAGLFGEKEKEKKRKKTSRLLK